MQKATGSGPIAKYAALMVGASDDYSKVMGGGQGSDSSRQQALNLVPANASPEQRAASIEGIRGAVHFTDVLTYRKQSGTSEDVWEPAVYRWTVYRWTVYRWTVYRWTVYRWTHGNGSEWQGL